MHADTTVTLRGMRFHVRVGTLPHEAELPQPLEIDVSVWTVGDDGAIIDYRQLYALAADATAHEPLRYLEDIAQAIVHGALQMPGVERARAAVRKPHVPLPGPLAHAEVVVERARESGVTHA